MDFKDQRIDAKFDREEYERLVLSAIEFQSHIQFRVLTKTVSGKKEIGRCASVGVRDALEGWTLAESPPDKPQELRVKGLDDARLYVTIWMTKSNELSVLEAALEGNLGVEEEEDKALVARFF